MRPRLLAVQPSVLVDRLLDRARRDPELLDVLRSVCDD
jgi:hypothetical protein